MRFLQTVLLGGALVLGHANLTAVPPAPAGSTPESLSETRIRLRRIYTNELNVREATGHNDGKRVEEYLHYVGLKKSSPWCAAFVCFCLGRAGIPNPRSGWCPDLFPASKVVWKKGNGVETGKQKAESGKQEAESRALHFPSTRNTEPATPLPGDVFGLFFPDKGRIAHAGFIDQWGDKYIITTEGNTNQAGSREGDGVYCKRRLISSIYKAARYCETD